VHLFTQSNVVKTHSLPVSICSACEDISTMAVNRIASSGGASALPPGANVCFAVPPYQISNIVTITMMVICVKLWTV